MSTISDTANTAFWLTLLAIKDDDRRRRLWNGYLGQHLPKKVLAKPAPDDTSWPKPWVAPPADGWPQLTDEDSRYLEHVADKCGGHPTYEHDRYMDFRKHTFDEMVDFSGLTLVSSSFDAAGFEHPVDFIGARFFHQTWFMGATFHQLASFTGSRFVAEVAFAGAHFKEWAGFDGAHFDGAADYTDAVFCGPVSFHDSRFSERYYASSIWTSCLTSFVRARFETRVSFRETQFGTTDPKHDPERRVDFSDAVFEGTTDFRRAVFAGPPAFFGTKLHRDTDFHGVVWQHPRQPLTSYNIRAWEQLELMMSELEKPEDRHRFFRLRMRALRRQKGDGLFASLSWLFERLSDYGWGVTRAFTSWLLHWLIAGAILFVSIQPALKGPKLLWATLVTGFANAHAFLGLTSETGYLAPYRSMVEASASSATLQVIGTMQAVFGPILLFLLLLTLRNRFRLA